MIISSKFEFSSLDSKQFRMDFFSHENNTHTVHVFFMRKPILLLPG